MESIIFGIQKEYDNGVIKNYYAYELQDKFLENLFQGIRNLNYIDIGAGNGINDSKTLLFSSLYGWKGICIEKDPKLFNELKMYRPFDINLNVEINNKLTLDDIRHKYSFDRIFLLTINDPTQLKILESLEDYNIDVIEFKYYNKEDCNSVLQTLNYFKYKYVGKTATSNFMVNTKSPIYTELINNLKS